MSDIQLLEEELSRISLDLESLDSNRRGLLNQLKFIEEELVTKRIKKQEREQRILELRSRPVTIKPVGKSESKLDGKTPHKRKAIPKAVRNIVWDTRFKTTDGVCWCCSCGITVHNFEAGHILAQCKGGEDAPHNLRPICGSCNRSMGDTDMRDFIRQYGFKGPGAAEFASWIVGSSADGTCTSSASGTTSTTSIAPQPVTTMSLTTRLTNLLGFASSASTSTTTPTVPTVSTVSTVSTIPTTQVYPLYPTISPTTISTTTPPIPPKSLKSKSSTTKVAKAAKASGQDFLDSLCNGRYNVPAENIFIRNHDRDGVRKYDVYISVACLYDVYLSWCACPHIGRESKSKVKFGQDINNGNRMKTTVTIYIDGTPTYMRPIEENLWANMSVFISRSVQVMTLAAYVASRK